jgi:hypothetical protein
MSSSSSLSPQAQKQKGGQGSPFKRVNVEEAYELLSKEDKELHDNSYMAKFGGGGYGAKANDVLSKVRGKDFRHEKTKKKRGSYRGGLIDINSNNSYKFED